MNGKACTKCGLHKPLVEFGRSTQRKDGLRPWCKICHNAANAEWRKKTPEYYRVRQEENPERRKKYDATYKKKNPTFSKDYYEENKHEFVERVNRRRGRMKAASLWADEQKIRLLYRVSSNLNRLHGYVKYHVDHIVPLQGKLVSGLHVHTNLRIIRAEENKAKFNKWNI